VGSLAGDSWAMAGNKKFLNDQKESH